ncbi:hypothetical protein ACJX0J_007719, partial [Zea mays]
MSMVHSLDKEDIKSFVFTSQKVRHMHHLDLISYYTEQQICDVLMLEAPCKNLGKTQTETNVNNSMQIVYIVIAI